MRPDVCYHCRNANPPGMAFCTNCGRPLPAVRESQVSTAPKLDFPPAAIAPVAPAAPAAAPAAKKSKLWIGGLAGCLGAAGIIVAVLVAAIIYAGNWKSAPRAARPAAPDETETSSNRSANRTPAGETENAETELLDILRDRREAGRFKQISATAVPAKDYFPGALGAVQASYHNGSRYVSVSIGKFADFELARRNFEEQFDSVRKKGGRAQVLDPAADGTIHGVYQQKGNSYAEYCTKSAFCYRLASADARALKYFIENFITL